MSTYPFSLCRAVHSFLVWELQWCRVPVEIFLARSLKTVCQAGRPAWLPLLVRMLECKSWRQITSLLGLYQIGNQALQESSDSSGIYRLFGFKFCLPTEEENKTSCFEFCGLYQTSEWVTVKIFRQNQTVFLNYFTPKCDAAPSLLQTGNTLIETPISLQCGAPN